jgi:hypothetical protein
LSVALGSRAIYQGRRVVVRARVSWLGLEWVRVLWRETGPGAWRSAAVHERSLQEVTLPVFAPGDVVRVGANRQRGTVAELVQDGDRVVYRVALPEVTRSSGVHYDGGYAVVGPEHLNL